MKIKILLFLLLIPAFFFLLKPGIYWNMHDDTQIIRQLEMEKCLLDGQIPCRWSPDLDFGYGYPLFNFYPPLPYVVGEFFRVFGFSFITTVKLTAISQILFSALAMYLCASIFFGPLGAFLSTLFYVYAPYRNLNIYVRGAMNEAWASVFFPLIFYFSYRLITAKKHQTYYLLFLSLSICGVLLSHNPMMLAFAPFIVIWVLFWLFHQPLSSSVIKNLLFSALLSFGLSAFFTLPVLFESRLVKIDSMFSGYYHYSAHFASLKQLFLSNFWGEGPSVWGTEDQMSFMVGYLHWLLPSLILIFSFYLYYRKIHLKTVLLIIFLVLLGFFSTFMAHQKSFLFWQLFQPLQKVQFPWRFLNISAFLFSFSVGSLGFYLNKFKFNPKPTFVIIFPLVLILLIINWQHLTPITHGPVTDAQKMSGIAWTNQITSGSFDYLPQSAKTAAISPPSGIIDEISPKVSYQTSGTKSGTDWLFFNLDLKEKATLTLSRLAFPEFTLYDRQTPIKFQIEPILGRIRFELGPGNHQLFLKLRNTPVRTIANYLSLLSWVFLIWKFLKSKK